MKEFPTLYKKTSTGAIQYWLIIVNVNQINTRYGQVDGAEQVTIDVILKGKNIGKKNETSPQQQAEAEAQAKWEKQLKKGYVTSIEAAEAEELDKLIEGGIAPMLAHKFSEQARKIKYPAWVQPKLDGIRCIAIVKRGKCTLWSRTRKPITSMPHIIAEIEKHFVADIVLDGELYNQEFKSNFEHIVHLVRQEEPDAQHTDVQYHIYDLVNEDIFEQRNNKLHKIFTIGNPQLKYLKRVHTAVVTDESQVMDNFSSYRALGYEGVMLRNNESLYVNKRSYDLQKVKEFDDKEFKITGIEEGRGKLAGHVGAFICLMDCGTQEFKAKMSGDTDQLKKYFEDHSLWKNKVLTVQYQGLTSYGIPRFPVGISIRDYE